MAITFPRELPTGIGFRPARFMLEDSVAASPSTGLMNYTETTDPVWRIDFTSVPLTDAGLAVLDAWWKSLRGGLRAALVTQNVTCRPLAHSKLESATPAQDTGVLDSITNGNVLAVSGVSPDLVLGVGDLIGLEKAGKRSLGRVTDVSGSGTGRTVAVEPPPRGYTDAGSLVRFERPMLVMRAVPKSWSVAGDFNPVASFSFVESPQ
ncbi:hypothetical protein [Aquamicrobium defluvii]|uniref:Uncharacterized protein n=1 Tax=Aquamicrobium defluvii TaxID=69279 RepID=A0A011TAF9_9HYPH|nr:hypothetical protein [Aquamicrobium defluvii]EXL08609.1 hypothetical protein BG36_03470 [Aquamicrobium defluvii]EZQ14879.1 hypothetical protein CF98_14930 [Halopseudomonas bauzanensis]